MQRATGWFQRLESSRAATSNHWKSIAAALVIACGSAAHAAPAADTNLTYTLAATNVLNEQLFAFVQAADLAGTIADDVTVAAMETAKVSGTVSNDLWMAARDTVEVSGHVGDHARLASLNVLVSGTFDRSLAAAGQTVQLATNCVIAGDADLLGISVTADGRIGSNLTIRATRVTLGGHIGGDVDIEASDIAVLPNTRIDGKLTYASPSELFHDKSVTIAGGMTRKALEKPTASAISAAQLVTTVVLSFGALLTGTLFVLVFPRFVGHSVRLLRQATWRCLFTGALTLGVLPLLALAAMPTLVGAPLALCLMASCGLFAYLGNIITALVIGGLLLRQRGQLPVGSALFSLALGIFVLYGLKSLPVVGFMLGMMGWFGGLGAMLLTMIHAQKVDTTRHAEPPPENNTPGGVPPPL